MNWKTEQWKSQSETERKKFFFKMRIVRELSVTILSILTFAL